MNGSMRLISVNLDEVCLPPEEVLISGDDMALGKEDKRWVAEQIRVAVEARPNGWKRLVTQLPLAAVIGIFVTLLALAGTG